MTSGICQRWINKRFFFVAWKYESSAFKTLLLWIGIPLKLKYQIDGWEVIQLNSCTFPTRDEPNNFSAVEICNKPNKAPPRKAKVQLIKYSTFLYFTMYRVFTTVQVIIINHYWARPSILRNYWHGDRATGAEAINKKLPSILVLSAAELREQQQ